ncbi:MAG: AMP-binding protein [Raineya sp.]|jgi:long-chain acyl-CoA synthetase|nr:AMP-binding protein [Raineya sp.]
MSETKLWLQKYHSSIPKEINPDQYPSLVAFLDEHLKKFANLPAYQFMDKVLTYKEVDKKSRDFAAYLQSLGLQRGDKVGLQMPNILQYPVALFGILRGGFTAVNVNPQYTVREMEHQYKDADVKATIIVANFAQNLEKALPHTNIKHVIVTEIGDMLGLLKGKIVNYVVKHKKKMVPAFNIPNAVSFNKTLSIGAKKTFTPVDVKGSDLAFLQYTGGTTGVSKGAMLTHRNILANMMQIKAWMAPKLKESPQEIIITPLPLYHVFALTVNCFSMVAIGAKNILIANPRDMPSFLGEMIKNKFTVLTGLNTLFVGMMNHPDFKKINWSGVKVVVAGGMAMQKPVAEKWKQMTGIAVAEGYGLSETAPVLTCNPIDGTEQIGSIGIPVPNVDIKLIDDDGKDVQLGEAGEICAKGPNVMLGYWNRPDETAKVFTEDGWFKTGDVGVMQEDGFFRIVDRKKDMILVSGFNVYPNEVEDVVAGHPKVLEVAAIGVPDAKATERVKIYIVKKDESLTEQEVRKYCEENLTGYKQPRDIEFRAELPKSNVGKILRKVLKDEIKAQVEASGKA